MKLNKINKIKRLLIILLSFVISIIVYKILDWSPGINIEMRPEWFYIQLCFMLFSLMFFMIILIFLKNITLVKYLLLTLTLGYLSSTLSYIMVTLFSNDGIRKVHDAIQIFWPILFLNLTHALGIIFSLFLGISSYILLKILKLDEAFRTE